MNKIIFFIFVFLYSGLSTFGQEIQFSPVVIPSGGGSYSSHAVNLSRWRIGEVHVITIPSEVVSLKQPVITPLSVPDDWSVSVFPNPVNNLLKVRFDMDISGEYAFEITDITGRKLLGEKARLVYPGQVEELNVAGLTPAIYMLRIIPSGEGTVKLFKITKQ